MQYLILCLCKWVEFCDRYNQFIPDEFKESSRQIKNTIVNRQVIKFRNKNVGHIWDKVNKQPLSNSETTGHIDTITNKDIGEFLNWLNDHNQFAKSIAGLSEEIRNLIIDKYDISFFDEVYKK